MPEFNYAVIIPAWNEAEFIKPCIVSAQDAMQQITDFSGQLIVVDNNSTDNTAEIARASGADVVFEPINQISRARNAGAAAVSVDWLVFVDADSDLNGPLLQTALFALNEGKTVGGGACIAPDRVLSSADQNTINSWNRFSRTMKWAAGCFVFCRADAFNDVGGFSLKRFAGEELVLSRALKRWGKKQGMAFRIIDEHSIITSMRKMDWYSRGYLLKQYLLALIPGAMGSKRMLKTWYDDSTQRTKKY